MRKTSQDGGDSTSITSGIENDIKKTGVMIKTKRNSIKRKVQNFSLESDDAVIEPLLQKDKEKIETTKQSAKFNLLSKTKTEATSERGTDKDKLISDDKLQKAALSNASVVTDRSLPTSNVKENSISKLTSANAPLHNHMNTNVFSNHDGLKTFVAPKSQILVEIDGSKHVGYNPSPLIFTTAKIHTDGKTKHMEPVQMTPVPILSTIEVCVMKSGINAGETSGHVTSNISAVYIPEINKSSTEQDPNLPFKTVNNTPTPQNKVTDTKIQMPTDKPDVKNNILDKSSVASSSKNTKLIQPNFSPTGIKGNIPENKYINKENKIEKEEYHIKSNISQPNSLTLENIKTIVSQEAKSGAASFTTTKVTNKVKENEIFDQAVIPKKDTTEALRYPENKADLKKTLKPDSQELQRTKPSDNANSSEKTSKDKTKDTTNRQLQRQNIVLDKEDPMSKLKPSLASPPLTTDSKGFNKSGEFQKPSMIEINTLSDKTKLPKFSANSIPITSVTSVLADISATDGKTYASTTTAVALNKKTSITSNAVINQTAASVINSAVKNNSHVTSASVNKPSFPTISSANKTFDTTTNTSNAKNISTAINKVPVPIATAAVIKTTSASITTAAAVNKPFVPISTPMLANKISVPITNIVAPNKVSVPSTSTTSGKNISSPSTSFATGNKIPFTSTTAATDNKISIPLTTTAASNKISAHSPITTTGSKLCKPITTSTATNKISATSTTTAASNKISATSSITTAGSKIPSPSTTTTAGNKISSPSSITTAGSKISSPSTSTTSGNKISSPSTSIAPGNKIPSTSTTNATGQKISTQSSTPTAGNKISVRTTTYEAENKISSSSTSTTAATNKISGPVITTSAIKMASGSTTTTTGVDKTTTSNSNSSSKPITSSSSTLPTFSNTPITKPAISTSCSASKPLNSEKYSSNASSHENTKSGTVNETSTTKSRVTSTLNTKPTSLKTTTKPSKVTTVFAPTTTSQQTTAVKSPIVTTVKSVPTKTIPQPAINKSTEITPKSSKSNEKPLTAKSNSTTTSGTSNVTSTSASLVSSGSSSASTEANKQSDSKSKVISNGSKSFKA